MTFSTHQGCVLVHSNITISSPHHLAKVQFPGFSLWTFYFQFPTFHAVTFRRKSSCAAHTEGGVCCKHWCAGVCLNISLQMSWGNTRWTSRLDGEPLCTIVEMILLKNGLKTPCTCKTLDWSSSDYMLGHAFSAPGPIPITDPCPRRIYSLLPVGDSPSLCPRISHQWMVQEVTSSLPRSSTLSESLRARRS